MRRNTLHLIAALLIALPLFAQTLTIGTNFSGTPTSFDSNSSAVRTVIDGLSPANATGIVTSAHVYWSQSGCMEALKLKFFRPSGNTLTMTTERGPFTLLTRDFTVTLVPPVPVLQGDLIGVTRLTNCGTPGLVSDQDGTYLYFNSDVSGTLTGGFNEVFGRRLALSGTGIATEDFLRGTITVVGSTAGAGGANFKTSLQLLNGAPVGSGAIIGKLVFHPAGTSGSSSDPTVAYNIAGGQVASYPDIVAMFGRSGLGSIDLLTKLDAAKPVVITRVFNDAGSAGSSGLTEDLIDPSDARVILSGSTAFLVTPIEPTKTRFNIGVRTGISGASLTAVLRDTNGNVVRTVTKSYLPNWFQQVDSTAFFNGTPIDANQSIAITVSSGSAIVYGSTTDNITNDPNIQFATVVPDNS